jgi:hypothetical protein
VNKKEDANMTTSLEDTMLVAFLMLKGHTAIPWLCKDDPKDKRVAFDIQGNLKQIEEDMQSYYANEPIGIQDFCRQLKSVKSILYNLKRIGETER